MYAWRHCTGLLDLLPRTKYWSYSCFAFSTRWKLKLKGCRHNFQFGWLQSVLQAVSDVANVCCTRPIPVMSSSVACGKVWNRLLNKTAHCHRVEFKVVWFLIWNCSPASIFDFLFFQDSYCSLGLTKIFGAGIAQWEWWRGYRLDGAGFESRTVQIGCGAHPATYSVGTGVISGGKAAGAWRLLVASICWGCELVELCMCFPYIPSWRGQGKL
jgi:hypothetical protein